MATIANQGLSCQVSIGLFEKVTVELVDSLIFAEAEWNVQDSLSV
jgi:hypothetical protein